MFCQKCGKPTNSVFGVRFPDIVKEGVFHYGKKCYPTQLFEVFSLILIFGIVSRRAKKFETYLFSYAVARFIIEFFRGDYRGNLFIYLSPAQVIAIITILYIGTHKLFIKKRTF